MSTSTSVRSSPDTRWKFGPEEAAAVTPLGISFVPGAILHAAELNTWFTSLLPSVGATLTAPLTLTFNNLNVPGNNSGQIIRWTNTSVPGALPPLNVAIAPLNVIASDYTGAVSSLWAISVSATAASTMYGSPGVGSWPQALAASLTIAKTGNCWVGGLHVTAREQGASPSIPNNNPSSVNNALVGIEIAHFAQADDDSGLSNAPGVRLGIHLSQAEQVSVANGGLPAVFGMGYNVDGSLTSTTKSCFGLTGVNTYQVFDARTATAPAGYTDPVAGLRMTAGQIVDFNGAAATTHAGWTGPAGSYLQFVLASPNRLRWVSGGNEVMSINDLGTLSIAPLTPNPAIVIGAEDCISFISTENRNLLYTQVGAPRLSYVVGGAERFNIPDTKPIVSGSKGGNAALASLMTTLAAFGLVTDSTT